MQCGFEQNERFLCQGEVLFFLVLKKISLLSILSLVLSKKLLKFIDLFFSYVVSMVLRF